MGAALARHTTDGAPRLGTNGEATRQNYRAALRGVDWTRKEVAPPVNPSPDFLNAATIERFRRREPLAGYFPHYDERCVEWPWTLSHIPADTKRLLDAGATLNHRPVLDLLPNSCKPFIHTLAPESNCYAADGISYVYGDLRELPYRDGYFDVVTCISVLEHVGMDNTIYGGSFEHSTNGWITALAELLRVLAVGGKMLLTVPYGAYEDAGWFQQFDGKTLSAGLRYFYRIDVHWVFYGNQLGWQDLQGNSSDYHYDHAGKRATAIACAEIIKLGA